MPQLMTPAPRDDVITANRRVLNQLRKGKRELAKTDPFLSWLITPLAETARLVPEIIGDIDEIILKEKKKKTTVDLPGWNDVIKIRPDSTLDPDELKRVKKERAIRISQSPTPGAIGSIGTTLTWLDDIQDSLVTLSYLGRVAAKIAGRTAPKLAGRFMIPLQYIAAARDLLSIDQLFKSLSLLRSQGKRALWDVLEAMPPLQRKKLNKLSKLKDILPSWREALQIAQTTEVATGYGLSLGPIVGAANDTIFGLLRGSRFKDVDAEKDLRKRVNRAAELAGKAYQSPDTSPLTIQCIHTLSAGSALASHPEMLSVDDNIAVLTAMKQAATYLNMTQTLEDWQSWAKPYLNRPQSLPYTSQDNQDIIASVSPDLVRDTYTYPFLGGVETITPKLRANLQRPLISSGFRKWLVPLAADYRVTYAAAVISELAADTFGAFEGSGEEMVTTISPEARAIYLKYEYQLQKELGTPEEIELAFNATLADILIRRQGASPRYDEVKALVDLFRRLY